jgi:hypothetical protein
MYNLAQIFELLIFINKKKVIMMLKVYIHISICARSLQINPTYNVYIILKYRYVHKMPNNNNDHPFFKQKNHTHNEEKRKVRT